MIVNPSKTSFFIPPGLSPSKKILLERIGSKFAGIIRNDHTLLDELPDDVIPVVQGWASMRLYFEKWFREKRTFLYWDRGYFRRKYSSGLPTSKDEGYYRIHVNKFQMDKIHDVPSDRWNFLRLNDHLRPWRKDGRRIIIVDTHPDYWRVRGLPVDWSQQLARKLKMKTDRPIMVRDKDSKVPLCDDLADAHCLVSHGSIAAVESVVMGTPVFVSSESAASLMGKVGFDDIENPVYPEREPWLHSLAYCQCNEQELSDGRFWRLIT